MQIRYDIKELGNELLKGLYAQNNEAVEKIFDMLGSDEFQTLAKVVGDQCALTMNQFAFTQTLTKEGWEQLRIQQTALQSVFIGLQQAGNEWSLGKHELQTAAKGESDTGVATS